MLNMIAPGTCGRKNRGIRNRRAVVAKNRTRERSREHNNRERGINALNHRHNDRNQDAERTPGSTRREGEKSRDDEYRSRKEHRKVPARRRNQRFNKLRR